MSALGHYLEEEGIGTVAISLIRPQSENTKPPRALWVPFELGRPFGPPSDPLFQRRVTLATLRLLECASGPVILEDFPEDDPRAQPDSDWHPPRVYASIDDSAEALPAPLETEIAALQGAYDRWFVRRGRTARLDSARCRSPSPAVMSPIGSAGRRRQVRATVSRRP